MPPQKKKIAHIPLHANELRKEAGVKLKRFEMLNGLSAAEAGRVLEAHRDDHYIFIVQEQGRSRLMLDFTELDLKGSTLLFILPGQVHRYIDVKKYNGWFVAVETEMVGDRFVPVFEEQRFGNQALSVTDTRMLEMSLQLLNTYLQAVPVAQRIPAIMHSMIQSFTGLVAGMYLEAATVENGRADSRSSSLPGRFRKLIAAHYVAEKSPAAYAEKLNLSLSYLNELVKKQTGFPVSYWIREQVLLESKRLLCYTALDVKEIAYRLGYSDHAYFCRMFKKGVGRTALEFRRDYRVLSNDPA